MDATQGWATTDEGAVAEARTGNSDAFRVLVERHTRSVYRLVYRMTQNEHDAEDLVQETFLKACRQLHRFDGRASFHTWLYRIAANCATDLLRARQSRARKHVVFNSETGEENPMDRLPSGAPSPERLTMSSEIGRLLGPAMNQLSPQERAAFVLRHYEGRSIEEIGHALKLRPNAAKHSIFRAVQKLRRALEPRLAAAGSPL
jgi:RNA polymerase sigma-70 factor (ECF subfamily)